MPSTKGLYEAVTLSIISQLEKGTIPWVQPWKNGRANGVGIIPANASSGRSYSGINLLLLWAAAEANRWPTNGFLTFRQANDLGGRIKKGEKSITVVFTRFKESETEPKKMIPMLKAYSVFSVHQCEGLPPSFNQPGQPEPVEVVYENALLFVQSTGAVVAQGGNKACYVPSRDIIQMPPMSSFDNESSYWATTFHELAHWSGHPDRLKRVYGRRFGDNEYAFEELVAELASAFLSARLGVEGSFRSAGYLENWLKVLKQDNRAIFSAASYASHAAEYLVGLGAPVVPADHIDEMADAIPY